MEDQIKENFQNSRGFITLILLIAFPLFFTVFALFYSLLSSVQQHTKAYSLCYKETARIQRDLRENLKMLLALNLKVKNLRKKRKTAERNLKTALLTGNPVVIKAAYSVLNFIKLNQRRIYFQQKMLFVKSDSSVEKGFYRFKSKSLSFLTNVSKRKKDSLAVKKNSNYEKFPDYVLLKPFSEKQQLKFTWKIDHLKFIPSFLKDDLGIGGISDHYCSVSLKGPRENFQIRLMK